MKYFFVRPWTFLNSGMLILQNSEGITSRWVNKIASNSLKEYPFMRLPRW